MNRPAFLLLAFTLVACQRPAAPIADQAVPPPAVPAASRETNMAEPVTLQSHHWRLLSAQNASGQPLADLTTAGAGPLKVDFGADSIALSGGCNGGGAGLTVDNDTLRVGQFVQTQMACAAPLMALDQAASQALTGNLSWSVDDAGDVPALTLRNAGGDTLVFAGEPTADIRYGGPGETVFLEIDSERMACSHPLIPDHRCLRVRELQYDEAGLQRGAPGAWEPLYEDIEGYTHVPGTRNVLRVKRYRRDDVPADATGIAYVHDMTVEAESTR